jgi:ParB-like chromosome segregation protein Spo0J
MNVEENNGVPSQSEASASPAAEPPIERAADALEVVDATVSAEGVIVPFPGPETETEPPSDPQLQVAPEPEPEPEVEYPQIKRHNVAPALISLDRIDEDPTFRIRPEGDLSQLATDIARLGQLFPVDIRFKAPDRFQVICGFRRVAALRFLQRDRVLARLHTDLTDEDALLMALVSAIHARPVSPEELDQVKSRLADEGRLTPAIRNMIEKAISPDDDLGPENVDGSEQEVDAEEMAKDVTWRLGEINQDLSLLADVIDSLDDSSKEELLQQLRYSSDLVTCLEGRR